VKIQGNNKEMHACIVIVQNENTHTNLPHVYTSQQSSMHKSISLHG